MAWRRSARRSDFRKLYFAGSSYAGSSGLLAGFTINI
jgi:hypothetical protein